LKEDSRKKENTNNNANQSSIKDKEYNKNNDRKKPIQRITSKEINIQKIIKDIANSSGKSGAIVLFIGTVRNYGKKGKVVSMTYESYISMAEEKIKSIEQYALKKWKINNIKIMHRIGKLKVGTNSIVIAISTSHSKEAYRANKFILEKIKKEVPIWKKEELADGQEMWVDGQRLMNIKK